MKETTEMIFRASLKLEEVKKDHAAKIAGRDAVISALIEHLGASLLTFEQQFESDEAGFTPDQMTAYILAANYLEFTFGRKGLQRRVMEKLNDLTF